MKISTKGRYALRLMLDLALHDAGKAIPLKEIAARQSISDKYLEQIISLLTHAGYLLSTRGAHGGYRLARSPQEYTVGMVLRLTEGSLAPVSCLEPCAEPCERAACCATLYVWQKLDAAISDVVDHITLQDLVEIQRVKDGNDYSI